MPKNIEIELNDENTMALSRIIVKKVTSLMSDYNFLGFEDRIRQLILKMLRRPMDKLKEQDEFNMRTDAIVKRHIRTISEMEFFLRKMSNHVGAVDDFHTKHSALKEFVEIQLQ